MSQMIAEMFRSLGEDFAQALKKGAGALGDTLGKAADIAEGNAKALADVDGDAAQAIDSIGGRGIATPSVGTAETWSGLGDDGAEAADGAGDAASAVAKTNADITDALDKVNPKYDPAQDAYSQNCVSVAQSYELRRRGLDVAAGPVTSGALPSNTIPKLWSSSWTDGSKADIEQAFSEPGSRGVVRISWNSGGGHEFNVENVGGKVRFIDGQPTPPVQDASHYFNSGHNTQYIRFDNLPTPAESATKPYLEP